MEKDRTNNGCAGALMNLTLIASLILGGLYTVIKKEYDEWKNDSVVEDVRDMERNGISYDMTCRRNRLNLDKLEKWINEKRGYQRRREKENDIMYQDTPFYWGEKDCKLIECTLTKNEEAKDLCKKIRDFPLGEGILSNYLVFDWNAENCNEGDRTVYQCEGETSLIKKRERTAKRIVRGKKLGRRGNYGVYEQEWAYDNWTDLFESPLGIKVQAGKKVRRGDQKKIESWLRGKGSKVKGSYTY